KPRPDSLGSSRIFLCRARRIGTEPVHELLVHYGPDVVDCSAVSQSRQDGTGLGFVFVEIGLEIDADRILFEENSRDLAIEVHEFSSELRAPSSVLLFVPHATV